MEKCTLTILNPFLFLSYFYSIKPPRIGIAVIFSSFTSAIIKSRLHIDRHFKRFNDSGGGGGVLLANLEHPN